MSYRIPAADVLRLFDAAIPPAVIPSPERSQLLLVEPEGHPPIDLLARPYLRLGGVRVDPGSGGARCTARVASLRVRPVAGGGDVPVRVPDDCSFGVPSWSPDGRRLAMVRHLSDGKQLWIADAATGEARPVPGLAVADALAGPSWAAGPALSGLPAPMVRWMAGGSLLALIAPPGRRAPSMTALPGGPRVEDTAGKRSRMHTFQDLLTSEEDERLFEHYVTAQLVRVDPRTCEVERLGAPALTGGFEASPDGRHLLVERLRRPFSHRVPWFYFSRVAEVWDAAGRMVRTVADLPVADEVPYQGVPTGPRAISWQANHPAALVWAEALDGGDPSAAADWRDVLVRMVAPFDDDPVPLLRLEHRLVGRTWLARSDHVLLTEWDRGRRWRTTSFVDLAPNPASRRVIFDLSVNDAYRDPGSPVLQVTPGGQQVAIDDGGAIYLSGRGAADAGARPFLDRFDIETGRIERLFQSDAAAYERFVCFAGGSRRQVVVESQTPTSPPNHAVLDLAGGTRRPLTGVADPHPEVSAASTRIVRYARDDGVALHGTLHLPPGYAPGDRRLPLLIWAYPLDYSDPATAGQVRGSDRAFTRLAGSTPLWLLLRGWAVLMDATMPVIGDPDTMNDTYITQVVASARAAIDEMDRMGIVDRSRVVAAGHSYGAFMTANLLAHSDLFAAGIARSGAYNRTLTPFGFQTERRSYWDAREVYQRVSPLLHADRITAPLLLIHGGDDENSGTYPMQSERLFQAIQGNGGTARLVVLPFEGHGYRARESVLHVVAEMLEWVERHAPGGGAR